MKYKCEMGRSMIEVLGVISIVGILSIGGIMAYSYGMDKYVANETAKGLIARAIDVQTQIDTCGEEDCAISLDIWKNEPTPLAITLEDDGFLHINKVPPRICRMLGNMLEDVAIIYVGNVQYDTNSNPCKLDSELSMYFSFDPSGLVDLGNDNDHDAISSEENMTTDIDVMITQDIEYTETPEIEVCPSIEISEEECNSEQDIDLNAIDDGCLVYRIKSECCNRELQGIYSIKKCDYWDAVNNDGYCPDVVSSEYVEESVIDGEVITTLFPIKPEETTMNISEPTELMARLKRENSSCPTPYYDSTTQTIYYYAEWDPWDKCSVRVCVWDTYANDWMCQM